MDARIQTAHAPPCHRCKQPMNFSSQEMVEGTAVNIYHCETCDTLEAFEEGVEGKAA